MARIASPTHLALCAALVPTVGTTVATAPSHADGHCEATRSLSSEMSMDGISRIAIEARAGSLVVRGDRVDRVLASGLACTRDEDREYLDDIRIVEKRDGGTLRIIADIPRKMFDSSVGALDLSITLPDNVPVSVVDSSGSAELSRLASVKVRDSSGSLTITDIAGDVLVERDSSGGIEIERVGNVTIDRDSSGSISVREALSLNIGQDSSGSIDAVDITGDFRVQADTSGSISAVRIGGDFEVGSDTSGGITARDVAGTVSTPKSRRKDDY